MTERGGKVDKRKVRKESSLKGEKKKKKKREPRGGDIFST